MSQERAAGCDAGRESLQSVFEALDLLEARLQALSLPGRAEAIGAALNMRRQITEALAGAETDTRLERGTS